MRRARVLWHRYGLRPLMLLALCHTLFWLCAPRGVAKVLGDEDRVAKVPVWVEYILLLLHTAAGGSLDDVDVDNLATAMDHRHQEATARAQASTASSVASGASRISCAAACSTRRNLAAARSGTDKASPFLPPGFKLRCNASASSVMLPRPARNRAQSSVRAHQGSPKNPG